MRGPANYIGTHHYKWKPQNIDRAGRREKNLAVYRDLERRKTEKHNKNWFLVNGKLAPLTPAQQKSGARRVA